MIRKIPKLLHILFLFKILLWIAFVETVALSHLPDQVIQAGKLGLSESMQPNITSVEPNRFGRTNLEVQMLDTW